VNINNNETLLKIIVRDQGPVAVMIKATYLMSSYKTGIFVDNICGNNSYNHAVLVTGKKTLKF
jgi:hypothetical protein